MVDHPSVASARGLGHRVRQMRLRRGMSQAALARPDLSDSYISLVEAGKRKPSAAVVNALAERLGCSVIYLTSGVEETRLTELKTALADARRALHADRPQETLTRLMRVPDNAAEAAEAPTVAQVRRVQLVLRELLSRLVVRAA